MTSEQTCPACLGHGRITMPTMPTSSAFGVTRTEPTVHTCPICSGRGVRR